MLVVMGPSWACRDLLYSAAFGPGFLLAGCYVVYALAQLQRSEARAGDDMEERILL